jgi:cell wall-associated NlpC family hydrolase
MTADATDAPSLEAIALDLVGRPYRRGARGPDAFDCWGLVLEMRRRLGLPLPPDFASHDLSRFEAHALFHASRPTGWRRGPLTTGVIVIAEGAGHSGVYLAARIVHAQARTGVVAWSLARWYAAFGSVWGWEHGDRDERSA